MRAFAGNGRAEEFYGQLAPPIDLSNGGVYQAPHLTGSALLEMGDESLIIQPEVDPIVPALQDYKVIAVSGLGNYMLDRGVVGARQDRFMQAVNNLDAMTVRKHGLPPGIALMHHGEEAILGRATTPQLELGRTASLSHASVRINDFGVRFADLLSREGTWLYLAPQDAEAPEAPLPNPTIDPRLSAKLLEAFSGLVVDGSLEHQEHGLVIDAELATTPASREKQLELDITEAKDYPDLQPEPGFMLRKIVIGPEASGLSVTDFSDGEERVSGISKATRHSPLTLRQAHALLELASDFYRR